MVNPGRPNTNTPTAAADDGVDRRKFGRVKLPLKARFLDEHQTEQTCTVLNISAGGALMRAKNPPAFGNSVILYIDQLGRFVGKVTRAEKDLFAVSYERRRVKSAQTADDLTQLINRGARVHERRNAPRIRQDSPARIIFEDGKIADCAILDISLTGASIAISPRPPLGARLIVGRMTAKVVRRHEQGVGVVFLGASEKLEQIMTDIAAIEPTNELGAPVAKPFGKKSRKPNE